MPIETQDAVNWAMNQKCEIESGISVDVSTDIPFTVVDKVREYFNAKKIAYSSFSYDDLKLYM